MAEGGYSKKYSAIPNCGSWGVEIKMKFVSIFFSTYVASRWMVRPSCPSWGPFHWRFLPAIQIRWKLCLAVIPLLAIRSRQMFAHATTAQLSCHVQNIVAITLLDSRLEWNEISIELEMRRKTVSETGPWSGCVYLAGCLLMLYFGLSNYLLTFIHYTYDTSAGISSSSYSFPRLLLI